MSKEKTNYGTFIQSVKKKLGKVAANKLRIKAREGAKYWETYIIEKMEEPKTGHEYILPDGTPYTASAPGEWPAVKTGNLIRSLSVFLGYRTDEIKPFIRIHLVISPTKVPYIEELEAMRPWIRESKEECIDHIKSLINRDS